MSEIWGAQWQSKNLLDGERRYLIRDSRCLPVMFTTKFAAKQWIKDNYGYIAKRKDLRAEPHGWRLPKAVKLSVQIKVE